MGTCMSTPRRPLTAQAPRPLPAPDYFATHRSPGCEVDHPAHNSTSGEGDAVEDDFLSVQSAHDTPVHVTPVTSSPHQAHLPAPREPQKWNWRKGAQLGKGAYGVVHLAHLEDTGQLVAVKQVEQGQGFDASTRSKVKACVTELEGEIRTLQKLRHPNIVQYLGCERTETHFNIFLEWIPGGSIRKILDDFGPLSETCVRLYTREVLLGLRYLHRRKIMHRDIKGQNVLVDNSGNIKLTDFGASKQINTLALSTREDQQQMSMKGTLYWMAPEMMQGKDVGRPADIWSLGCLVIEMATAQAPWHDQLDKKIKNNMMGVIYHIVNNDIQPKIPESMSREGKEFLQLCFDRDPRRRANCERLLLHPFVANVAKPNSQALPQTPVPAAFSPIHEEDSGALAATPPSQGPNSGHSLPAPKPPVSVKTATCSPQVIQEPSFSEAVNISEEPLKDDSPERISPREKDIEPAWAKSMMSFNPMQSYADDLRDTLINASPAPIAPIALSNTSPPRIAVPDTIQEEAEASMENVSQNTLSPVALSPGSANARHAHLDIQGTKNPLYGMQNSLTVSHTGFAHQLADAAVGKAESRGALAPISEHNSPWHGRSDADNWEDKKEEDAPVTPRAGFTERARERLPVLPPMNDPSRPSTGFGRRPSASAHQKGRMSDGDFNSVMEQMLSNARKSYGEQMRQVGMGIRSNGGFS